MRAPSRRPPLAIMASVIMVLVAGCSSGSDRAEPSTTALAATTSRPGSTTTATAPTTTAPTTTTSPSTTTTTTTAPTTTAPVTTVVGGPPPALTTEAGALVAGTSGTRTLRLQRRLKVLKFDPGEADGRFGTKTTMAVWAFQALHGLAQDGVVTPELETRILAAAPAAMLRPALGPTHSEVDLAKQVLLVFGNGRLELATHVSTGSGLHYCDVSKKDGKRYCGTATTPPGSFHYQRRISGWRESNLGRLYNPVYFNGGIAVHGAPSVPGHPASHGCVRIPMHIAGYFPDLVANGEPIVVI